MEPAAEKGDEGTNGAAGHGRSGSAAAAAAAGGSGMRRGEVRGRCARGHAPAGRCHGEDICSQFLRAIVLLY
jgi:hypothetical protein